MLSGHRGLIKSIVSPRGKAMFFQIIFAEAIISATKSASRSASSGSLMISSGIDAEVPVTPLPGQETVFPVRTDVPEGAAMRVMTLSGLTPHSYLTTFVVPDLS